MVVRGDGTGLTVLLVGMCVKNKGPVFGNMVMAETRNIKTPPHQGENNQTGDEYLLHNTPVI
jgi:hypothetical protein